MSGRMPSRAVWREAEDRIRGLRALAKRRYPVAEGYYHDEQSDGWPDIDCIIVVYERRADRRCKRGYRMQQVTVLHGVDLSREHGELEEGDVAE